MRSRGRQKGGSRHGPESEYTIQKSICELLDLKAPWLLYCASAGGVRTSIAEARRMKATGYKRGFPDLFFYEPREGFMGLAIELKRDKGRATPDQKLWKEELQRRGYKAVIARGYSACMDAIKDYFSEDNLDW
jgi:hypothetical protein